MVEIIKKEKVWVITFKDNGHTHMICKDEELAKKYRKEFPQYDCHPYAVQDNFEEMCK